MSPFRNRTPRSFLRPLVLGVLSFEIQRSVGFTLSPMNTLTSISLPLPHTQTQQQSRSCRSIVSKTCLSSSSSSSSSSSQTSSPLSVEPSAPRSYENFAAWAVHYGLDASDLFQLTTADADDPNNWSVMAGTSAEKGTQLLHVPAMLILSSKRIMEEDFPHLNYEDQIKPFFEKKGAPELIPQFYLFLKLLREYPLGSDSPYFPWFDALPRRFSTAVSFDDFEMTCLPPFVGSLARLDRINYGTFTEALQRFQPEILRWDDTKIVVKWAFNIVFTRCWATKPDELHIVPMADMFNHASIDPNVQIKYDDDGNCNVFVTDDVVEGQPLTLSYGHPTNPSRFLSTFGFLDQTPPATFCKIMTARPSKELKNLGYDFTRMVFYVADGAIAEEVWDVVLWSLLEDRPEERQRFYHAHMTQDRDTKIMMHSQYLSETTSALLLHVNKTLRELVELAEKMQAEGPDHHENLMLIWNHNEFVKQTFLKVKARLDSMAANEKARREEAAASAS